MIAQIIHHLQIFSANTNDQTQSNGIDVLFIKYKNICDNKKIFGDKQDSRVLVNHI